MSNYLDTRDLYKRQQELQSELDDLESERDDAQESYNDAVSANLEALTDEEESDTREGRGKAAEALEDAKEALEEWSDEYLEELDELNDLENEIGREWIYGTTLISEDDFKEYAQDLAEDLGMDRNQPWPFSCIDWDQAAEELKQDYSSVEFQGETYWFRA